MTFQQWWDWQYTNPTLRNSPGTDIQLIYAYSKAAWDASQENSQRQRTEQLSVDVASRQKCLDAYIARRWASTLKLLAE